MQELTEDRADELAQLIAETRWMGDRWSEDPADPMLAAGGRRAAVRHDPNGHEDCAVNWDPCGCHGDRLCRLGSHMRVLRMYATQLRLWEAGPPYGHTNHLLPNEVERAKARCRREIALLSREMWPWLLANARQDRERVARALERWQELREMSELEKRYAHGDR